MFSFCLCRFHILLFNADAIMQCVFPYYGTNLFVRVVQLIDPRQDTQKWFEIAKAQVKSESDLLLFRFVLFYFVKNWQAYL